MSADLRHAIYDRLVSLEDLALWPLGAAAQAAIHAALADDPDVSGKPAVFSSTLDEAKTTLGVVPLPCVTFRLSGGLPDERFADGMAVGRQLVELEVWVDAGATATVEGVMESISTLLDKGRGAAPALGNGTGGRCWWCRPVAMVAIGYQPSHGMSVGLMRFEATVSRVIE
jgi:hypothetical protein